MASRPIVGLIPAAGFGRRMGLNAGSKEIVPIGRRPNNQPRPAISYLLERLGRASIRRALVVLRSAKLDIATDLEDGGDDGVDLVYRLVAATRSTVHTLDAARPWTDDRRVALGFPDLIFEPVDAYAALVSKQEETGADLVLGLFPAKEPERTDMVELAIDGRPQRLFIRDPSCDLRFNWSIALWTPVFTEFLHAWLSSDRAIAVALEREIYVGDVIQSSLEACLHAEAVAFPKGSYLDVGTPRDLVEARQRYGSGSRSQSSSSR